MHPLKKEQQHGVLLLNKCECVEDLYEAVIAPWCHQLL